MRIKRKRPTVFYAYLVIEDERALCETIVRSLRRLAYSVDPCYDGDTAIDLLGSERYDLVLLDLNLPGKDGMTVLRTLRQTDWETRVLILSARGEVADKVEGLDAGANDYLAKPFHLEELEARIRSLTLRQFTQTGCGIPLRAADLRYPLPRRHCNGQRLTLTAKGDRDFGISDPIRGGPSVRRSFWSTSGTTAWTISATPSGCTFPLCGKNCGRRWAMTPSATASARDI